MALDKPAALPFFFKSDTDLTTLHKDKLTSEEQFSLRGIMQRFKMHTSINPLLPSIFRSVLVVTNNKRRPALQLMNEPLALGFLAQDACHHLIEQTDGITEDMLGAYPKLMDQQAWATFVEQLFGALDEANAPMLARQVLHAVYPHCVKFNQDVVNTGIRKLREMGLNRFDGPSSTLWDRLKSALDSADKIMQKGYADAVVRASLRHNLATGGTVPPAWAHWIGKPLLDDDFDGELRLPNKREITERVAYLHELLSEPHPRLRQRRPFAHVCRQAAGVRRTPAIAFSDSRALRASTAPPHSQHHHARSFDAPAAFRAKFRAKNAETVTKRGCGSADEKLDAAGRPDGRSACTTGIPWGWRCWRSRRA